MTEHAVVLLFLGPFEIGEVVEDFANGFHGFGGRWLCVLCWCVCCVWRRKFELESVRFIQWEYIL